jgi:cytochrome c6
MKKILVPLTGSLCLVLAAWIAAVPSSEAGSGKSGEALFKEHCAVCHPDGGNIVNPKKTLHKKDREANNIKTKADIVRVMRKPGPGMSVFDAKIITDHDAEEIAEYVQKAFSK